MRALRRSSAHSVALSGFRVASLATRPTEMSVPRIAAAHANRVASMPSSSRRATSPPPRAERFSSRSSLAEASLGSISLSRTLARSSTVSYGLPPVTAHTSRQKGASACPPRVARVRPAVASGVRALRLVTGWPAAPATASRSWALSVVASPGRRATTTRTDRSSRRSAKAASQRRVSWSAQWASSTISTSGQSRRANRRTAATSPSHTPCGSAWRSPGSAMPRAGPAMSYQSPRYSRASSGISDRRAGWRSWRTTLKGTDLRVSPPRADQTVQPRASARRRVAFSRAVLPKPASPRISSTLPEDVRPAHRESITASTAASSSSRSHSEAGAAAKGRTSVIPLPPQVARTTYRSRA